MVNLSLSDMIDITTDSLFNAGTASTFSRRNSNSSRIFNAYGLQLGMVHNFPKKDEQLTADANYFSGKNEGDALYTTNYYDVDGNYTGNFIQQQLIKRQ